MLHRKLTLDGLHLLDQTIDYSHAESVLANATIAHTDPRVTKAVVCIGILTADGNVGYHVLNVDKTKGFLKTVGFVGQGTTDEANKIFDEIKELTELDLYVPDNEVNCYFSDPDKDQGFILTSREEMIIPMK